MKIEIDLNDILGDEYGSETLAESVKRQVIDSMKFDISKKVKGSIDEEIARQINSAVSDVCKEQLPEILNDLMDTPYVPVGRYGSRGEETTIRKTLISTLEDQMQYKKKDGWGNREKNYFSEHIDEVTKTCLAEFNKSFREQINEDFKREALSSAVKILSEKLGLK